MEKLKKILLILLFIPILFITGCDEVKDEDEPKLKKFDQVEFVDKTFTYDYNFHSLRVEGYLPEDVQVIYTNNDKVEVGQYEVTAELSCFGYESATLKATLTIVKADMHIAFIDKTATYDTTCHTIEVIGEIPEGVTVRYENNELTDAGSVVATAYFESSNPNFNDLEPMTATLTVNKAEVLIDSKNFTDVTYDYDGTEKQIKLNCPIPKGVEVTYENNTLTEIGTISAIANLRLLDTNNYLELKETKLRANLNVVLHRGLEYKINSDDTITILKYNGEDKKVVIPEKVDGKVVTKIGKYAFNRSKVTSVKLPDTITDIEMYAFCYCLDLVDVNIPANLSTVRDSAFCGVPCKDMIIPKSLYWIERDAFRACQFSKLNLEGAHIFENAFSYCSNLVELTINDCILENKAFSHIPTKEVRFLSYPTYLPANIFNESKVERICFPEGPVPQNAYWVPGWNSRYTENYFEEDLIPTFIDSPNRLLTTTDGIIYYKEMVKGKFTECSIVGYTGTNPNVVIPDMIDNLIVTKVLYHAFYNNNTITNVEFKNKNTVYLHHEVFTNCPNLVNVTMNDNVIVLGDSIFENCSNLHTITLSLAMEKISYKMFYGCESLIEITLPNNVTSIEGSAFAYCTSLKVLNFNNIVSSIGVNSLEYCTSLEGLVIPGNLANSLTYEVGIKTCKNIRRVEFQEGASMVSDSCFEQLERLEEVVLSNTITSIGSFAFYKCINLKTITMSERLDTIGQYAFMDCYNLSSISLPNSLHYIEYRAFLNCKSIKTINIPANVTTISESVFSDCINLESVTLGENVGYIESFAFYNCYSLRSINLKKTIHIGESAFEKCTLLTEIIIPLTTTYIGDSAFSDCRNLKYIYCEAESIPSGWNSGWNKNCNAEVVWGYKK